MENALNISPGLMLWTLFNFTIVLILIIKFAVKPIVNGLRKREEGIQSQIDNADKANASAQELLKESQEKLMSAQKDMAEIIQKGRVHAEQLIQKAVEEAENVKRQKVAEAIKEIERSKENAIQDIKSEVAGLVVMATEKLLDITLDKDKHFKLVDSYIDKLPKN